MWRGIYKRWNPVAYLEGKRLYVEAVLDDSEGFRIRFSSENTKLGIVAIVKFETVQMYVNSDEMYRLSDVQNSGEVEFPHTFWKVENSTLLKEFNRQSLDIYKDEGIEHYAFLSCGDCVDVLSFVKPTFVSVIDPDGIKEL
jgi:hypothetical protein